MKRMAITNQIVIRQPLAAAEKRASQRREPPGRSLGDRVEGPNLMKDFVSSLIRQRR
jgi:hypothetical protein